MDIQQEETYGRSAGAVNYAMFLLFLAIALIITFLIFLPSAKADIDINLNLGDRVVLSRWNFSITDVSLYTQPTCAYVLRYTELRTQNVIIINTRINTTLATCISYASPYISDHLSQRADRYRIIEDRITRRNNEQTQRNSSRGGSIGRVNIR
jgi:hypothetical protein